MHWAGGTVDLLDS